MLSEQELADISGNAPDEVKSVVLVWLRKYMAREDGFALSVQNRVKIVEVSVNTNKDEPKKLEGRMVCELEVAKGNTASVILCKSTSNKQFC